jgi:CHASE2 domain-containing sensor protein
MKRVALTFLEGCFEEGFPVLLRIQDERQPNQLKIQAVGKLPPSSDILRYFQDWEDAYLQLAEGSFRIKTKPNQQSNFSVPALATSFKKHFNDWLKSEEREWKKIRKCLSKYLSASDEILVIVETEDLHLRRLPWHLWKLFSEDFPNIEVAISPAAYQALPIQTLSDKTKILAILGNSGGINVDADRQILKGLANVEVHFIIEPPLQQLMDQLWDQSWDILYFAGHSSSRLDGSIGFLWLQDAEVPIERLKEGIKESLKNGLRVAIFNSCDGLGLAKELAELNIPQVVVMREPVHDEVAQEFLKYFSRAFDSGKSLYLAVNEARRRLQGLEDRFPCASWLPVICQNTSEFAVRQPTASLQQQLWPMLLASVAVSALVMGIRQIGWLQPLELKMLDNLQQLRPAEKPDPRLLVVAITESDIQSRKEWPLSDRTLGQLLAKLEKFQPQVIGLDLFRDFPVKAGYGELLPHLRNSKFIGTCAGLEKDRKDIAALSNILSERLGFSDVVVDDDGILRRHLLAMQPEQKSTCQTTESFSFQLALHYLAAQGVQPKLTSKEEYQLRNTVFKPLSSQRGGYRTADTRGYQVLLNYRVQQVPQQVAQQVTLSDVLDNRIDPKWVKDRVVLIGVTAESIPDNHLTPYSNKVQPPQRLPGVFIHAQMVSQVLSTVLDGRPLLWVLPDWVEGFWILGWSMVGVLAGMFVQPRFLMFFTLAVSLAGLVVLCWVGLLYGGWLPLIPAGLVLIATGTGVAFIREQVYSKS